jgi:hypothetical protein
MTGTACHSTSRAALWLAAELAQRAAAYPGPHRTRYNVRPGRLTLARLLRGRAREIKPPRRFCYLESLRAAQLEI